MLTALITGVEGFTGQYLAPELDRAGYAVVGLAGKAPTREIPGVRSIHVCDLCELQSLSRVVESTQPDVVVHLAAISFVGHGDMEAIYRTNVVGSRNLLDALGRLPGPVRAVLLASSANVYGNAMVERIDESVPPAPPNDYAVSKLAMEYLARLWADRLPITIVRPFNYTGVGQSEDFLLPKIVNHFRRRDPAIELGSLDVVRDFSDVRLVANCYRKLLDAGVAGKAHGEIFNTCSGRGHSLHQVLDMMREISGYSPEVRCNPAFVRTNEIKSLVGSRAKLESAIGKVTDIPLMDTLRWMYESP